MRLAITWPADADECVTVGEELQRMADALDRNVWVPEPGCIATGIAGARLTSHPGWLPLTRKRPRLAAGFRLIEINVPRRHPIDLPETLSVLADVPVAASSLAS